MNKNHLSAYLWILVVAVVLALMIVFATPFGKYIANAVAIYADKLRGLAEAAESPPFTINN